MILAADTAVLRPVCVDRYSSAASNAGRRSARWTASTGTSCRSLHSLRCGSRLATPPDPGTTIRVSDGASPGVLASSTMPCLVVTAPLAEMGIARAAYEAAYTSNVLATSISLMSSVRATPTVGRPHGMRALSPTGRSATENDWVGMVVSPWTDQFGYRTT